MKTTGRVIVILSLVLATALVGCKKDEKKSASSAGGGAAKPAAGDVRQALAMIPIDADGVLGVDLGALRKSELFKSYEKDVVERVGGDLAAFKQACGFDPMDKVQQVVAGAKGKRGSEDVIAVLRGLPRTEMMACADKASKDPTLVPDTTVTIDGAFVVVSSSRGAIGLTFIDDATLVAARKAGAAPTKAEMDAIVAAKDGDGITGSKGFMDMIDGLDTTRSVWFVLNGHSQTIRDAGRGFLDFEAAFGTVDITSSLDLQLSARLESEDAAKGMADGFGRTLDSMKKSLLKGVITDVTVESKGKDVRLHAKMTRDQLTQLADFAKGMLGNLLR